MAKSKLQRIGKEKLAEKLKQKKKLRRIRNISKYTNRLSYYLNFGLFLYITHLHGHLIPLLTNIYENVAPIVESIITKLPI
jgi:hypothetical protein